MAGGQRQFPPPSRGRGMSGIVIGGGRGRMGRGGGQEGGGGGGQGGGGGGGRGGGGCNKKNQPPKASKGSLKPIRSAYFHDRFQVDLIDMRKLRKRDPFGVLM
jgi:hypothetical protein